MLLKKKAVNKLIKRITLNKKNRKITIIISKIYYSFQIVINEAIIIVFFKFQTFENKSLTRRLLELINSFNNIYIKKLCERKNKFLYYHTL